MKQQTYAEFQYKLASSLLREVRQLNYEDGTAEYIRDVLLPAIERSYVEAARKAIWMNYDQMPAYHRYVFWWRVAAKYNNQKAYAMANQAEADWLEYVSIL